MTVEEIEAIVGGYHGDAFRILGPHRARRKGGQPRWEVRAFLPQAESAGVVAGAQSCPMQKQHDQGFFCAALNGDPEPYAIRAKLWDGREVEIDDPYRYGPQISDSDLYLHTEGTLYEAYLTFGAHLAQTEGAAGVRFAVWAPNAENVTVTGEFNDWDSRRHPMRRRNGGVWELFIPGLGRGRRLQVQRPLALRRLPAAQGRSLRLLLRDPAQIRFGGLGHLRTTSGTTPPGWRRAPTPTGCKSPVSIYEVHLESWMRGPKGQPLTYREMAVKLVEYARRWATRTSSCCPSWSIRSPARGATR